jgi:anti-sigma factor ChrR (cupin superfamily)
MGLREAKPRYARRVLVALRRPRDQDAGVLPSSLVLPDLAALARQPDALAWTPLRPGIEMFRLYGDPPANGGAALLRYAPGASLPAHRHSGYEHIFVLAGAQSDERGRYPAGTLVVNPPGSGHSVSSAEGCIVLISWEHGVSPQALPR